MQTFDFTESLERAIKVVFIVIVSAFLLIWLNQNSLDRFWQQKYHQPSPWVEWQGNYAWDLGGYIQEGVIASAETFTDYLQGKHIVEEVEQQIPEKIAYPREFQVGLRFINGYIHPATQLSETFPDLLKRNRTHVEGPISFDPKKMNQLILATKTPKTEIVLQKSEKVLFIGDSMMQGVAPLVKSQLAKQYSIDSIDLSKQSTGLSYPKFFNWPETVRTTLANNPDIKLLVVFLGPNDPWDMPPETGKHYLRFSTPDWEEQYRNRIKDILLTARMHNVDVIWISPPNMRKDKLSKGVNYLTTLYQSEVENAGEFYLSANVLFKYKGDVYSDYFGDDSSNLKLRSGDGIHFTPKGQRTIANAIFGLINIKEEPEKKSEDEQNETTESTPKAN